MNQSEGQLLELTEGEDERQSAASSVLEMGIDVHKKSDQIRSLNF